ncbi:MAG: hypothetical protein AAGC77_08890 [Pseudomonadota bacterium]
MRHWPPTTCTISRSTRGKKVEQDTTIQDKSVEAMIAEIYQGEVFGEAFVCQLLKRYRSPDEQYKLGTLLQLETETKARIRPIAAGYGIDLVEDIESRTGGKNAADALPAVEWGELMSLLLEPSKDSSDKYRAMAEKMPSELAAFAKAMDEHEYAIHEFFVKENNGQSAQSVDHFVAMLQNPLPKPSLEN